MIFFDFFCSHCVCIMRVWWCVSVRIFLTRVCLSGVVLESLFFSLHIGGVERDGGSA